MEDHCGVTLAVVWCVTVIATSSFLLLERLILDLQFRRGQYVSIHQHVGCDNNVSMDIGLYKELITFNQILTRSFTLQMARKS